MDKFGRKKNVTLKMDQKLDQEEEVRLCSGHVCGQQARH